VNKVDVIIAEETMLVVLGVVEVVLEVFDIGSVMGGPVVLDSAVLRLTMICDVVFKVVDAIVDIAVVVQVADAVVTFKVADGDVALEMVDSDVAFEVVVVAAVVSALKRTIALLSSDGAVSGYHV
jgi:hypothetical protein